MPKVPNFPEISDETPNFLRKFGHLEFFLCSKFSGKLVLRDFDWTVKFSRKLVLWEVDSTPIFGRITRICRKSGRYGRKPRIYSRNWYTAKAVAEVLKIGNLRERLVVANPGWQSESSDGPKSSEVSSFPPPFSFSDYQTTYLSIFYVSMYLCINLSLSL